MKRLLVSPLLCFLLPLVLSGCFGVPRFSPTSEPLSVLDSRARCEEVMQRRQPASSMRALVNAELVRGDESGQFRYAIVSRDSTSIRVDLLPPEGAITLAILVVHDGVTTLVNAQEKTFAAGNDESELVERFFGISGVTKDVVLGLLSGVVPELFCDEVTVYDSGENSYVLLEGGKHIAWNVNRSGIVRSVDILDTQNSAVHLRAKLTALSSDGLPTISLDLYKPYELKGSMVATTLTLNQPVQDRLFDIPVPANYRQVD